MQCYWLRDDSSRALDLFLVILDDYARVARLVTTGLQDISQEGGEFVASDELFGLSEGFDEKTVELSVLAERIQDHMERLGARMERGVRNIPRAVELRKHRFFNSMFRFFDIPTDVRVHSAEGDVYPVDYAEFDAPSSANLKLRGATSVRKGVEHIFEMIQQGGLRPTWPGKACVTGAIAILLLTNRPLSRNMIDRYYRTSDIARHIWISFHGKYLLRYKQSTTA